MHTFESLDGDHPAHWGIHCTSPDWTDVWRHERATPYVIVQILDGFGGAGANAHIVAVHGTPKDRSRMLATFRDFTDEHPQCAAGCAASCTRRCRLPERPPLPDEPERVRLRTQQEEMRLLLEDLGLDSAVPQGTFFHDRTFAVYDADLVGLRAPIDPCEEFETFHGAPFDRSCQRPPRRPAIPVLALKARTSHWVSITARDRSTGPPPGDQATEGRLVAPGPSARSVRNERVGHVARKPSEAASAHRLPLGAPRFGEANGQASLLLSEPGNAPSITTTPQRGRSLVRGTGGACSGMSCAQFMHELLATSVGRIVAANILAGLRLGLYDHHRLCPVLTAWNAIVTREGYTGEEIPAALIKLKEPSAGSGVSQMHVFCRRPLSYADPGPMASVRQLHRLEACFGEDEIRKLNDRGIDLKARPGTASYKSLPTDERQELQLNPEKSLTNPELGDRAILWYTTHESLESVLNRCSSPKGWADAVRDKLGLIHCETDKPIAAVELPYAMTEERADCGRPTFVEAGAHARFRCDGGSAPKSPWGTTVDLGAPMGPTTASVAGLPERVCGRVPNATAGAGGPTRLWVRVLGAPTISRRDPHGSADVRLANLLEQREVQQGGGVAFKNQLLKLCGACQHLPAKNYDGNL